MWKRCKSKQVQRWNCLKDSIVLTIGSNVLKVFFVKISLSQSYFNPHVLSGPVHLYQLDEFICNMRGGWCTFSFLFSCEEIFLLANSIDPDQKLHYAAFCGIWSGSALFAYVQKMGSWLIWVKFFFSIHPYVDRHTSIDVSWSTYSKSINIQYVSQHTWCVSIMYEGLDGVYWLVENNGHF